MKLSDLIKIEIFKFRNNTLVQLLLVFFTIFMSVSILVMKNIEGIPLAGGTDSIFQFPYVWEYQAYAGSWLTFLFLGFLGLYLVTSEISWKTMRQNIITGYSRLDYFIAKILIAILISVYATIIFYLATIAIGYFNAEDFHTDDIFDAQNYVILRFLLMTFAYVLFGMMMGFIFRKSGLALLIYFSCILFIEPLLRWGVHYRYIAKGKSMLFYPLNGIEDLTPLPFYKYIATFSPVKDFNILLSYQEAAVISIISVLFFVYISYIFLVKRDI